MTNIVVDACCLINLLAAGDILSAKSGKSRSGTDSMGEAWSASVLHVPNEVAEEALYILRPDDEDPSKLVKSKINLSGFIDAGVLCRCSLDGEEELGLFMHLAIRLDDGEAACLAIAKSRAWTLATDDRVAMRLAEQLKVQVVNTAQLVKTWAEASDASDAEIARIMTDIQTYARFVPRPGSPESDWWYRHARTV